MAEEKSTQDIIAEQFDVLAAKPEEGEAVVVEKADATVEDDNNVEEVEVQAETGEEAIEAAETNQVSEEGSETTEIDDDPIYDKPAPDRWTASMKETYEKLPPEAKKMMVEDVFIPMQQKYTETTMSLSKMKEKVAPLLEIMEDYSGDFEKAGANPVEAIRRQAAWATHFLKVGVEQGVKDMQQTFGVDVGAASGQVQDEYLTPVERQLKSESIETRNMVKKLLDERQNMTKEQQDQVNRQRMMQVQKDLREFINEQKDGKPLHPNVEKVAPQIVGILKGGLVTQVDEYGEPVPFRTQMEKAYRMACDLNPATRPARGNANRQRQVDKAKAARDVSVVTTESSATKSAPMTISQAIDAAYDKLAAG